MVQAITSLQTASIILLVVFILLFIYTLYDALKGENWFKLGKNALTQEKFSTAINYFTRELESKPSNAKAYLERAKAYRGLGDLDKALDDENKAEEILADAEKESAVSSPIQQFNSETSLG